MFIILLHISYSRQCSSSCLELTAASPSLPVLQLLSVLSRAQDSSWPYTNFSSENYWTDRTELNWICTWNMQNRMAHRPTGWPQFRSGKNSRTFRGLSVKCGNPGLMSSSFASLCILSNDELRWLTDCQEIRDLSCRAQLFRHLSPPYLC